MISPDGRVAEPLEEPIAGGVTAGRGIDPA
jgi:hypothetical protein